MADHAVAWRDSVVAYLRVQAQPEDKFGHQPRLYALCVEIARAQDDLAGVLRHELAQEAGLPDTFPPPEPSRQSDPTGSCDDDVLFAAAWMHDLGVFLGHRPSAPEELARWDHVPYTIRTAESLLRGWGFPEEKLAAVTEVIRTHQPKDTPVTSEAIVLRDADILEQLGAVGALRAIVKVGRDTRYPSYSAILPVLERAVDELPAKLRTRRARELAVPRVEILRAFLSAARTEAGRNLH